MLRVCPLCHTASNDDLFCPNDGVKLVDPGELSPAVRADASTVAVSLDADIPVPLGRREPPPGPKADGDPLIGTVVAGRYRVLRQLGEGGMGNVYRAVQESIEKKVALKVLKSEYSSSPDMVVRFHREAVSACRIKHPNVVDVFDLGQLEDGRFYIAMDLLEGRDLSQVLHSSGPLSPSRGVNLALQICRALNAAHQSGIVHRDLKPENVFLHRTSDGDEIVKIVDFGIAHLLAHGPDRPPPPAKAAEAEVGDHKLTNVGTVFGTPEYMAPEQAAGGDIDHRADIYATGIILYKMFTGQTPFAGSSFLEILAKHVGEEPPRMSKVNPSLAIPRELEQVILRALEKKPEDRFENMARFAQAIAYASRDIRRSRGGPRRSIIIWVAVLAGLVIATVGVLLLRNRAAGAPEPTTSVRPIPAPLPTPIATAAREAVPAVVDPNPELAPSASSGPAPPAPIVAPSANPPAAVASAVTNAVKPGAVGKPRAPSSAPKGEPPFAPRRPKGNSPADDSLPSLERCFETVAGVRREVPCN